jgi:hypothetical protein
MRGDEALKLIICIFFLTIRRADFMEIFTTVLKLCAEDITEAERRYSFAEFTHTACRVASSPARTCSERGFEREREREREKQSWYMIT